MEGSESSSRVSEGGSGDSGESNTSGAAETLVEDCRGFGHVSLKVLPERKHNDGNLGLEESEGEELERERGRTSAAEQREETAIEAISSMTLSCEVSEGWCYGIPHRIIHGF